MLTEDSVKRNVSRSTLQNTILNNYSISFHLSFFTRRPTSIQRTILFFLSCLWANDLERLHSLNRNIGPGFVVSLSPGGIWTNEHARIGKQTRVQSLPVPHPERWLIAVPESFDENACFWSRFSVLSASTTNSQNEYSFHWQNSGSDSPASLRQRKTTAVKRIKPSMKLFSLIVDWPDLVFSFERGTLKPLFPHNDCPHQR